MVSELTERGVCLELDTVIVDEAGCVAETATPLLLRLHPSNLVLVGDHLQLPAFTALMDPPRNHYRVIQEAEAAQAQLRHLGISRPSIFILTLYNKQRYCISDKLAKRPALSGSCQVLSVDYCQGDEADAVIFSTVRTTTSGQGLSAFFNDRRRINVGLSRARHLCVLVGSRRTLQTAASKEAAWATILRHYRQAGAITGSRWQDWLSGHCFLWRH